MDWITQEQAKQAAEQGELPALECSLEHHKQGQYAGTVELIIAIENGQFNVGGNSCACCHYKQMMGGDTCFVGGICKLRNATDDNGYCCNGRYRDASRAFDIFIDDHSNANCKAFQDTEAKLCTYIEEVIEKVKAKDKKCEKCEKYEPELVGFVCGWCNRVSVQETDEDTVKVSVFGWGDNAHPAGATAQAWNFSMNELTDFYQKLGELLAKQEKSKC